MAITNLGRFSWKKAAVGTERASGASGEASSAMDLGKLLASKFTAKNTEETTQKAQHAERVQSTRDVKDRNYEAVRIVFEPILKSFNDSVGSGAWLKMELRPPELRFDHGFNRVLLIVVHEAHVEVGRGGSQGRWTKPFPKPFFFLAYTEDGKPIFSESYHIESAWMTAEEFAAFCLEEALNID